jgi:uncharacterized protein
MTDSAALTPSEVAEQVRRMVAGEGVVFADLFAVDGVLEYPFALPGQPPKLVGREAIRGYFVNASTARALFRMDTVTSTVFRTDDPDVVITQIDHSGTSAVTGKPYRFHALGVIRVRDGRIVHYQDYMDPIATAQLLGRTRDLADAITANP